jgi:hypothetical protein
MSASWSDLMWVIFCYVILAVGVIWSARRVAMAPRQLLQRERVHGAGPLTDGGNDHEDGDEESSCMDSKGAGGVGGVAERVGRDVAGEQGQDLVTSMRGLPRVSSCQVAYMVWSVGLCGLYNILSRSDQTPKRTV